jgi:3-hydroxybutyrate dehydrogenase
MSSMKDRVALVTGSTSGIGLATANALASRGCSLALNSFSDTEADRKVAADLAGRHGVQAVYLQADMMQPDQARSLVQRTMDRFGRIDILVNNAGIQYVAAIEDFPTERWDAIIAVNLTAAFHTCAVAVPLMRQAGGGRIVNIASAHGLRASPYKVAYVAAKHGIVGLTKTVALETAEQGITCNAVCPGFVLTPLVDKQIVDLMQQHGIHRRAASLRILAKQPSKDFVTVEQVAEATAYLCSDAAAGVTGTTLSIDGGWTAQ